MCEIVKRKFKFKIVLDSRPRIKKKIKMKNWKYVEKIIHQSLRATKKKI